MTNYKLVIQYDGTRYKGWQRLKDNENTIQSKIEHVLSKLAGEPIEIIGSSRTDAGVHALMQIANFKMKQNMNPSKIKCYVNTYLPQDIRVTHVNVASDRFHARYHTKAKTYLYKIWNDDVQNPFLRAYAMHVVQKLHIHPMKEAAQYFIGKHDFTTFSNAKSKKKSMVREIYSIVIEEQSPGLIEIRICGEGFLYNMVRKMVGVLIEVGLEKLEPRMVETFIQEKVRGNVHYMAFAGGLFLENVELEEQKDGNS